MLRRALAVLSAASAVLAGTAVPAAAAVTGCLPSAAKPLCQVWTGKVSWVADGDTPQIDIDGDGTAKPVSVRLIGVQAMEQSAYSPVPAHRRGECHALAATARVEYLVKRGGGKVRLTAQHAVSHSDVRNRPLRAVAVRINNTWYDIGLDLIRNGYALWMPSDQEWAWNPAYRHAARLAARDGRNMYDTDACGVGPFPQAKLTVHVNHDAPGDDTVNVNGEWVRVTNESPSAVALGGWWLRDSGLRRYTFPAGTVVPAGGAVTVHVGRGVATATEKHWGLPAPVFGNPTSDARALGDGAYLFDPQGDLRSWMIYP